MKTNSIADFIARKMLLLHEHPPLASANKDGIARVKNAIEVHNSHISNSLGLEGYNLTPEELKELKITMPQAFKKPVMFETTASKRHYFGDGEYAGTTSLSVEITL